MSQPFGTKEISRAQREVWSIEKECREPGTAHRAEVAVLKDVLSPLQPVIVTRDGGRGRAPLFPLEQPSILDCTEGFSCREDPAFRGGRHFEKSHFAQVRSQGVACVLSPCPLWRNRPGFPVQPCHFLGRYGDLG